MRVIFFMKLLMVTECSDPYEPSATVALCSSVEEAAALGFKELWIFDCRKNEIVDLGKHGKHKVDFTYYKDLLSNASFKSSDGANYPQPMVEWVETGVVIGESEYAKGKIHYKSPNKKKS